MPKYSHLEWLSLVGEVDVGMLVFLGDPIDDRRAQELADHLNRVVIAPFQKRCGLPADESHKLILQGADVQGVDAAIADAKAQLAKARQSSPKLGAVYILKNPQSVAPRGSADQCQAAVLLIANHAVIDALNLSSLAMTGEGMKSGPARSAWWWFRARMRGFKEAARNAVESLTARGIPYEPRHVIVDIDRDRAVRAASVIGVRAEAMLYAIAYTQLKPAGAAGHWIDRISHCQTTYRIGAIRYGIEPFLRFSFDILRQIAGNDLVSVARSIDARLAELRPQRDQAFVAMQTTMGIYRRITNMMSDRQVGALLEKEFASRLVFSLYPVHPERLFPAGTRIVDSTVLTLSDAGIFCIVHALSDKVRFSMTVDEVLAGRLSLFEETADDALRAILA